MKRKYLDKISAIILIVFGLIVYFILIPTQIGKDKMGLPSAFFPELSIFALAGLSLLLFIKAHFERKPEGEEIIFHMSREEFLRLMVILVMMSLYVILLHFVGFIISSPVILGLLMYYSGQRKWKIILPIIVFIPVIIYLFFEKGLKIILSQGIFF
ncbi:MAG: hypothetical protein GTN76_04805 [Candidatus Aenigmarchaeota archaeon]|nr:hypothetical protein [Candidatus Aenigmarchaeota archaeon]